MAELPDLTVFAQILSHRFAGKTIKAIEVKVPKKLKVTVTDLKSAVEGKKLVEVIREGKTLELHFSGKRVLGLHLMLRGELQLLDKDNTAPKFEIMSFHFANGEGFAVTDRLKQATPTLDPIKAKSPDALEILEEEFISLLAKKKGMVKEVLMDQKVIRGIGNSYADEILWDARISPMSLANTIPEKVVKTLYTSMNDVLKVAIKQIKEENGNELHGELRDFMKVHGAKIKKSPTGKEIQTEKIGGRSAYFTDEQKLYR